MAGKREKFNMKQLLSGTSLSAAAGEEAADETARRAPLKVVSLSVHDLVPSSDNFYSAENIADLKMSIEMFGVKQNLTVKPLEAGKYEVIAGHRRRLACLALLAEGKAKFEYVPCGIETERDELKEKILLIMTNSTARQLTDWEKMKQAEELRRHFEELKKRDNLPGRVRDMVADFTNTSATNIARMDAISNNLSESFMQEFQAGKLGVSVAYEISGLPEDAQREAFQVYTEQGGISLNDIKRLREGCADIAPALRGEEETPEDAPPPATSTGPGPAEEIPGESVDENSDIEQLEPIAEGGFYGDAREWLKYPDEPPALEDYPDEPPAGSGDRDSAADPPPKEEKRDFADMTVSEKADSAIALLNHYRFTLFQPGTDTRIYDFIIDALDALGQGESE